MGARELEGGQVGKYGRINYSVHDQYFRILSSDDLMITMKHET